MATSVLQCLGLNALESDVYTLLLAESEPITAYRIGKQLGKPTANVYKAIDALTRKGAVIVDESEPKLCRPVHADEFLGHLEKSFSASIRDARSGLEQLGEPPPDERVYHLRSVPLVFERARAMLQRAQRVVVLEAFPGVAAELRGAIQETIDRGVEVYLQLYGPLAIEGGHVVSTHEGDASRRHWRSEQLNLAVDGRELLLALLEHQLDDIYQALWTNSLYLSCLFHAGLMREHFFSQVGELAHSQPEDSPLNRLIAAHPVFHTMEVPGQVELFARLDMRHGT
jgi:sugar-specific transcriptional regulator TrmB